MHFSANAFVPVLCLYIHEPCIYESAILYEHIWTCRFTDARAWGNRGWDCAKIFAKGLHQKPRQDHYIFVSRPSDDSEDESSTPRPKTNIFPISDFPIIFCILAESGGRLSRPWCAWHICAHGPVFKFSGYQVLRKSTAYSPCEGPWHLSEMLGLARAYGSDNGTDSGAGPDGNGDADLCRTRISRPVAHAGPTAHTS